jgi:hypothetical protein
VSDAELRALERAAASGDDEARLRWAEALARAGSPQQAVLALTPFFEREGPLAAEGRLRAALLYFEAGEVGTGLTLLARPLPDGWLGPLRSRVEAAVTSTEHGARAARALGNLAPVGDLARVFVATRLQPMAPGVRALLAAALRRRDRALAQRVALEEHDLSLKRILLIEGELLL